MRRMTKHEAQRVAARFLRYASLAYAANQRHLGSSWFFDAVDILASPPGAKIQPMKSVEMP